jgi:hypothetical protein
MRVHSLESRVTKLERAYRPDDVAFYLLWAADEHALDRARFEALAIGEIQKGDILVAAVWPGPAEMPRSRWVGIRERIRGAEEDAMFNLLLRVKKGDMGPTPPPGALAEMTDAELLAIALGTQIE